VDDRTMTSHGGFHKAANLDFVRKRYNEIMGSPLDTEMYELLALVRYWKPVTRGGFLARLRAGRRLVRGKWDNAQLSRRNLQTKS
jgi:hypothetical protein